MNKTSIFYTPSEYRVSGTALMGRNVASETFLRAYLKYANIEKISITIQQPEHLAHFKEKYLSEVGR